MILFARGDPMGRWVEGLPAARPIVPPSDRAEFRGALARLRPGGDATLFLDGAASGRSDLVAAANEFSIWAERKSVRARVVFVGGAQVYGAPKPGIALREEDAAPADDAGRRFAALEAELSARAERRNFSLIVARVFDLLDPVPASGNRLSELARRVRAGDLKRVAGLGATRDYLDVRDLSRALGALAGLAQGTTPLRVTVNLCSGRALTGHDLLREVVRALRPADETALMAAVEGVKESQVPWLVGNPARLVELIGGNPALVPLRRTIEEAGAALR